MVGFRPKPVNGSDLKHPQTRPAAAPGTMSVPWAPALCLPVLDANAIAMHATMLTNNTTKKHESVRSPHTCNTHIHTHTTKHAHIALAATFIGSKTKHN